EIKLATGFNDVEKKIPMSPSARMPGGSTGKMWAGVLATLLIMDGKLQLEQKLKSVCEGAEWCDHLPNRDSIVLRHLLQHTSGLDSYFDSPEFLQVLAQKINPASPTYEPYYRFRFSQLMSFSKAHFDEPGTRQVYSENGYLAIGYMIGQVLSHS